MYYTDDTLLPENMDKLMIIAAPWGPTWLPQDFPEDIALSIDDQVQKAVDCYNAGASILHIHVRDPATGELSTDFAMFNDMIARLRKAVPKMVLQIGGSISFAPHGEGEEAGWLDYDTRHMICDVVPKPDQITIAVGTSQMDIMSMMEPEDAAGTHLSDPAIQAAFRDMIADANPSFYYENLKRMRAKDIQPFFMLAHVHQLETVERLIRQGAYTGPVNAMLVALGGAGGCGRNPYDMLEFIRRMPHGGKMFMESTMRTVPTLRAVSVALGNDCRVGIEDNIWGRKGEKMGSVAQVEQIVRIAKEIGREIATGDDARSLLKIGTWYKDADETLQALGLPPNRKPGQQGFILPTDGKLPRFHMLASDSHPRSPSPEPSSEEAPSEGWRARRRGGRH